MRDDGPWLASIVIFPPGTSNQYIQHSPSQQYFYYANTFGITQDDDTQLRIVMNLPPGTTARNIHLNLEEDTTTHVLSISRETKREENGISVRSRFERSYTLHPRENVDTSKITAQLDTDGVLTIIAPKHHPNKEDVEGKENVRMIDIVEQQAPQQNVFAGEDDMVIENNVSPCWSGTIGALTQAY